MNAYLVWHSILHLREQIVDWQDLPSKENKIQAKLCQVVLQPAQAAENNSHKLALQTAG